MLHVLRDAGPVTQLWCQVLYKVLLARAIVAINTVDDDVELLFSNQA